MEKLKTTLEFNSNQSIEEQMIQAYRTCSDAVKYCNQLGIPSEQIEKNIVKIYDFVADLNYCKHCPGVDKCQKNNPCLITVPTYERGYVDKKVTPCKQLLKKVSFERQFVIKDFDESWMNTTLKDLDASKERAAVLAKYANYVKTGNCGWIYINGGQSSGRSFLAAALVIDAAKRDKGPICFLNSSLRINELKELNNAYKSEEFQKKLNYYASCPILVLDDFGNEYKNDMIRDAIVFQIISTRASKKLFTIITSDFTISEIETLYTTSKAGEIRARQIAKIIRNAAGEEINLGDLAIY